MDILYWSLALCLTLGFGVFVGGRIFQKEVIVKATPIIKERVVVGKPTRIDLFFVQKLGVRAELWQNIPIWRTYYLSCKDAFQSNGEVHKGQALIIDGEYFIIGKYQLVNVKLGEQVELPDDV